jgi:hypothetical protein
LSFLKRERCYSGFSLVIGVGTLLQVLLRGDIEVGGALSVAISVSLTEQAGAIVGGGWAPELEEGGVSFD